MLRQYFQSILSFLFLILAIYSCANMSTPTGGPKDEDPPVFVRSVPEQNALNFSGNKIEIYFDENIQLDKISEKLLISPPQKNMPLIKFSGKKISIELLDTIQKNTTYTIDFSDAIVDNNEKNVLNNFVFSFSTGETIDSLEVSGMLLNAADLEPITGKLVGLHKNLHDSAFTTEPFYRIGNSDVYGKFSIKNLAEGTYKIYALSDMNRDYKFDQPTEDIAFLDSLIIPHFETRIKSDTIWKDSITVDTIHVSEYTHYLPDDVCLRFFKEIVTKNQFLQKQERLSQNKFSLYFNAPAADLPNIKPLNFTADDWFLLEKNATNDTLHYWISRPEIVEKDTLSLELEYLKTNNVEKQLVLSKDTIQIVVRKAKVPQKKNKKDADTIAVEYFQPTVAVSGSLDLNLPVRIEWESPVASFEQEGIHLEIKSDTVWLPQNDFKFEQDSSKNIRSYICYTKWKPGGEYRLSIDSTAFVSIYNTHNKDVRSSFKIKKLEEYGFVYFNLQNLNVPAFIELLDKSDKVVQKSFVHDNTAEFLFLRPGTYYARIILDENENGLWDTGNYAERLQPEQVYYYTEGIPLMANFEVELDWDIIAVPVPKQKPVDLIKNKPKPKNTQSPSRR